MAQEYEQPVNGTTSPRTQRMTAAESRAVIALWQQERTEQTGLTDRPAVPDVAEGLDITVEDVQRLLSEVRARRQQEERALAAERELSEVRMAEEERKLAEVRRQRVEVQRQQTSRMEQPPLHSRWVEVRPGVWEDAELEALIANQPPATKFARVLARVIFLLLTLGLVMSPFVYIIVLAIRQMSH